MLRLGLRLTCWNERAPRSSGLSTLVPSKDAEKVPTFWPSTSLSVMSMSTFWAVTDSAGYVEGCT